MPAVAQHSSAEHVAPSPIQAVDRLVDSAQQLVVDHIELASLEARETLRTTMTGLLLGLVGGFMVTCSWGALMLFAFLTLVSVIPDAAMRVIALGGVNLVVGAVVLGAGLRLLRHSEEVLRDELP